MFALIEIAKDIQESVIHTEVNGAETKERKKYGERKTIIGLW
jgi:hypothetical protein